MKIPKYWVRANVTDQNLNRGHPVWAWGWSNHNSEDARQNAVERAKRLLAYLTDSQDNIPEPGRSNQYAYEVCPLREEILQTHHDDQGKPIAIVTRNRYGALVLNAANICFIDIDDPEPSSRGFSFWDRLRFIFSSTAYAQAQAQLKQRTLEGVHTWAAQNPTRSFRLYRTAAGLRLLFTDKLYDPLSPEVDALFKQLGSDPLYRTLTRKQECFRARLTPKPWRCGIEPNSLQYPFLAPENNQPANAIENSPGPQNISAAKRQTDFNRWVTDYDNAAKNFAVCTLLQSFGKPDDGHEIQQILTLHDVYCLQNTNLPLA
jgi:hypothetical protein